MSARSNNSRAGRAKRRRSRAPYKDLLLQGRSHQDHARDLFYRALRHRAPAVMEKLDRGGPPLVSPEQSPTYAGAELEAWPTIAPLGPFVRAWAERHHLPDWAVIDAIDYVLSLRNGDFAGDDAPCITTGLVAPGIRGAAGSVIHATVELDFPTFVWSTGTQSRADFEAWVRGHFEAQLKQQLDGWERLAKALGMSRLNRPELWRDMQRVVRRVVLGHSPADILRIEGHPNADPQDERHQDAQRAVSLAIAKACDSLGMPRPKQGRPPKGKPRAHCVRILKKRN